VEVKEAILIGRKEKNAAITNWGKVGRREERE